MSNRYHGKPEVPTYGYRIDATRRMSRAQEPQDQTPCMHLTIAWFRKSAHKEHLTKSETEALIGALALLCALVFCSEALIDAHYTAAAVVRLFRLRCFSAGRKTTIMQAGDDLVEWLRKPQKDTAVHRRKMDDGSEARPAQRTATPTCKQPKGAPQG